MATAIWKGPNGSTGQPTTGDFGTASNWSTGDVPDAQVDVFLRAASYEVDVTLQSYGIRSLKVGQGVMLALRGADHNLTVAESSSNEGQILIGSSYLDARGGLLNLGTIFGGSDAGYIPLLQGSVTNFGGVSTAPTGGTLLELRGTFVNAVEGVVATQFGGTVFVNATFTNEGLVTAVNAGTVKFGAFGSNYTLTNLDGGVLSGGDWTVQGGATLWLTGATVSVLADGCTVTLAGQGSTFRLDADTTGDTDLTLESTLDTVDAGATLAVLGGRDYRTGESLTVDGTLQLGGGVFDAGSLRVGETGVLGGRGRIDAQAIVDGAIRVDRGGTLTFADFSDFNGQISGRGTLELSGGSDTFTTSRISVRTLLLDGADVQLDRNLTYAGKLVMTAGTLDVTDRTLTLTGTTTLGDATIHADARGDVVIEGTLNARGGHGVIDASSLTVDGTIGVSAGSLALTGMVGGTGTISVGNGGTLILQDAGRLTADPLVSLDGRGATIDFDNLRTDGVRIANFDGNDSIVFSAFRARGATFAFNADQDGTGGTLVLTNGRQVVSVHLEENHTVRDFTLAKAADGGTVVMAGGGGFAAVGHAAFGSDADHAAPVAPVLHDPHLCAVALV